MMEKIQRKAASRCVSTYRTASREAVVCINACTAGIINCGKSYDGIKSNKGSLCNMRKKVIQPRDQMLFCLEVEKLVRNSCRSWMHLLNPWLAEFSSYTVMAVPVKTEDPACSYCNLSQVDDPCIKYLRLRRRSVSGKRRFGLWMKSKKKSSIGQSEAWLVPVML